jgi:hypothetical protein
MLHLHCHVESAAAHYLLAAHRDAPPAPVLAFKHGGMPTPTIVSFSCVDNAGSALCTVLCALPALLLKRLAIACDWQMLLGDAVPTPDAVQTSSLVHVAQVVL